VDHCIVSPTHSVWLQLGVPYNGTDTAGSTPLRYLKTESLKSIYKYNTTCCFECEIWSPTLEGKKQTNCAAGEAAEGNMSH
jgi:hypothetical protein